MKTIMTEQGLLIPKEELAQWGELVVERRPYRITIRPKSVTHLTYGALKASASDLEQILDDVEAGGAVLDHGEPPSGFFAQ